MKKLLLAMFVFANTQATFAKPIKILTWWDFIAEPVVSNLAKSGFDTQIITYRTNETAIARLSHNKEKFDVAIVSSIAIPLLVDSKSIVHGQFDALNKAREYPPWITQDNPCVPYFWSATVFTYDSKYITYKPNTLQLMAKAKLKDGYEIAIIDDPFEFSARFKLDYGFDYGSQPTIVPFNSKSFVSSVGDFLKRPKIAVYGWHGESAAFINDSRTLTMDPGRNGVVVGYDAVCLLNPDPKARSHLKEFITTLTSKENTSHTMKETQYFSPYLKHTEGLHSKVIKLRSKIDTHMSSNRFTIMKRLNAKKYIKTNKAWQGLRYGP